MAGQGREGITYVMPKGGDTAEPEGDEFVEQISDDADLQQHYEELLERTKDASGDATLRVYQIPTDASGNPSAGNRGMAWLFSAPMDRYDLDQLYEKIRKEFMYGPENSITVRMICTKKGSRGMLFNRLAVVKRGIGSDNSASADPQATLLTAVDRMMSAQAQRMEALFSRMAPQHVSPAPDFFGQLAALVTPFMPAIVAYVSREPASGGSLGDALKAIQVAKGLVGPGGATTEDDSDSVTGIMKAASPFAGVLQALVTRIGAPAAPAVPAGPALPAPTPPPTVAPPPAAARPAPAPQPTGAAPTAPTHSVLFLEIANNLNQLAGLVAVNGPANMDPKQIAGMVAAQLPDELPEDADALLFEANSFERLKQLAPKIGETPEIAEWFKKFLDEIRAIYSDDAPPGATG